MFYKYAKTVSLPRGLALFTFIFACLQAATCVAENYYIDSDGGSDANAGTSPGLAWATLDKVSNWNFEPGDQILLQRGDSFNGKIFLNGQDNGEEGNPVIVGAYGTGDLPVISAVGYRAGVHIRNARHISVSDLEIHGDGGAMVDGAPNNKRYGVLVDASGTNTSFEDIIIRDLYIHDIFPRDSDGSEGARPNPAYDPNDPANDDRAITWYGTGIAILGVSTAVSSNVIVEGCRIETVGYKAIDMKRVNQIDVLNNHMADIGGPAIQPGRVNDLVVRGNVVDGSGSYSDPRMHGRGSGIWPWTSERILIEKNTFMHARGRADSCGIHIDFNCRDVVVQYNLSIDNGGGFIEILGNNHNCTYRYNISINDGNRVKGEPSNGPGTLNNGGDGHLIWVSGYVGSGNTPDGPYNSYIYNNTMYVKADINTTFSIQETTDGLLIANNIFYVEGPTEDVTSSALDDYTQAMADRVVWVNNLYQRTGILPVFNLDLFGETSPVYGDPLFANTGGLAAGDYIPSSTALVQDKGIVVEKLPGDFIGLKVGLAVGEDFFGNPVLGLPDMGAVEIGGTPPPLPAAAFASAPEYVEFAAAGMTSVEGPYNTEYYFTETSGNLGGDDSGWQLSPTYLDTGLLPNTRYAYTVTMRNALDEPGTASASSEVLIPANQPYETAILLAEDFSSAPDPVNEGIPFPEETWYVAYEVEEQDASVNSSDGGLRIGWGYDSVQVCWYSQHAWNLNRNYSFSGDWEIANVLDVHLGMRVGFAAFDPVTGELLQLAKEVAIGDLTDPTIGQTGSFALDLSAAELASLGVSNTSRVGITLIHEGAGTPERNDVYLVDNLQIGLQGTAGSDFDGDGIPDAEEPGLGLDPGITEDGAWDADGDGMSNYAEFLAGTDLNDAADAFIISMSLDTEQLDLAVPRILPGRVYILEQSPSLQSWTATDAIVGSTPDPVPVFTSDFPSTQEFFRVRVEWE
jgi:hypothetical protein